MGAVIPFSRAVRAIKALKTKEDKRENQLREHNAPIISNMSGKETVEKTNALLESSEKLVSPKLVKTPDKDTCYMYGLGETAYGKKGNPIIMDFEIA